MSKSSQFSTKCVFGQLISLIDDSLIRKEVEKCDSDRYTKRFMTKDHLISMLFCSFSKCTSLREISGAMLGLSGKTSGFRLNHIPKKGKEIIALKLRKVTFYDRVNKREFEFLTNLFDFRADLIAGLYKIRWQIELLFKQLKQNFPLKYFFKG